jgi:hypothetical protein
MRNAWWLGLALVAGCRFDTSGLAVADLAVADRRAGEQAVLDLRSDAPADASLDSMLVDGARPDSARPDGGVPDRTVDVPRTDTRPPDTRPPDTRPPDTRPPCNLSLCPLGCHPTALRCLRPLPSNYDPAPFHDLATAALKVGSATLNGSTGEISGLRPPGAAGQAVGGIYWNLRTQTDGSQLAVFAVDSLEVTGTLKIAGTVPVALYVRGAVQISGTIDASAAGAVPGPGGRAGGVMNGAAGSACGGGEGQFDFASARR